jgi:hypothetical protein
MCAPAAAPTGSYLVRCCPNLQEFSAHNMECLAEHFTALWELSSLRQLVLSPTVPADPESDSALMQALCQLTQLQCLILTSSVPEGLLPLQLTRLQGLTCLSIEPRWDVSSPWQERGGLSLTQVRARLTY